MKCKKVYIGEIKFDQGTISATDPCYDRDVWCRIDAIPIHKGTYKCYIYKATSKKSMSYGRVARIEIIRKNTKLSEKARYKFLGMIGVDAGLAGFFQNKPDFSNTEWQTFCDKLWSEDQNLESSDKQNAYMYEDDSKKAKGFFSSSGWGDGSYEVFKKEEIIRNQKRISALQIRFL